MKRNNCVLVIAGPSAVGKTVVAKQIVESDPRFTFLRSGTTRAKRGDAHDDEYLYYTEDEFLAAAERGEFAEYMRYGGNLYGTPNSELQRALDNGKIPLMVLDMNGVKSLYRHKDYSACSVYLYTDINTVEQRLYERYLGTEPSVEGHKSFEGRKEQNIKDYLSVCECADCFFRFVENNTTVEECRDRVLKVFESFEQGAKFDAETARKIASELAYSTGKINE